jgi:hypothetical protein
MNFDNEENIDVKILKIQENFLLSPPPIPQPRSEAQEPTPNIYPPPPDRNPNLTDKRLQ